MKVVECLYCNAGDLIHITERSDGVGVLKCAKCGVMMVDRLNADTAGLYTADYFEKKSDTKNGYKDYFSSPVANLIGKYAFTRLFVRDTGSHVDLGCADGSLMEIFACEGFQTHGLEISQDAVKFARDKGLDAQASTLHSFPTKLPKSHVITAFDLLEHTDRPGVVLKEVYRNLEQNGYFIFSTLSVKKSDPSEYWFNNSLEHYVYYTQDSLAYILSEVFGADNFGIVEQDVNGIAELWGYAKKGPASDEKAMLRRIETGDETGDSGIDDPDSAYLLSLFYNQVSKFGHSKKIIVAMESQWHISRSAEASFYNYYFQGKLDDALKVAERNKSVVPVSRSVYWQAVAYAEEAFSAIRQKDIINEYDAEVVKGRTELQKERDTSNDEVLELRTALFKVRDELHTLKNSRVVGRIIKARNVVGDSTRKAIPVIKSSPRKGLYKTRKAVAKVLPPPLSRAIMRGLRGAKRRLNEARAPEKQPQIEVVNNQPWVGGSPLVSVVIPYYDRADTIDDTLDSLVAQTFRNFEVIIVDDGSTDTASVTKLKHISQAVPALQIVHQENQGVATARNNGIEKARGKYVVCLDSDDILDATFIEKAAVTLETAPDTALITSHQDMFGVIREVYQKSPYDPLHLYEDNMVITAAMFRKEAWVTSGGYKGGIGYEDWEFWLNLAEHGFWGKLIPEALFKYRTSMQSRYVEDKDVHWSNIKTIRSLHPRYKSTVRSLLAERASTKHVIDTQTAFINLTDHKDYEPLQNGNSNILITVPWMTFGGAETLIYNFCREIKSSYNISFITGLKSDHEWEYKFREISSDIYHLANLFEDEALYVEFICNYIGTRKIDVLHIIHNGFVFDMLPEIKKRHPHLKVAVTVFNDRAPYCEQSIGFEDYVDMYAADNQIVTKKYEQRLRPGKKISLIPNGINCYEEFNLEVYDRPAKRAELGIASDEIAVFFVGRLSEEKNPDVFLGVAGKLISSKKSKRTRFFMIGDGPMKPEIEKMLKDISDKRVTYLGYQSEIAKYLSAADIFVLPSSVEGFPLSILEAMAMNVVPVASRVGGVPDIIDSGTDGFVVTPGSVDEIAKAIIELEQQPALLDTMKTKARQKIEKKFSNRILGANYRKMYESTLE